MKRVLLVLAGSAALFLGVMGIFLPLLPTTPFLLLAAACYIRSSKGLYGWLINHRWFGDYIRNYLEGRGIPLRTKVFALLLLWASILYSAYFVVALPWVRLLLLVIAAGVTTHIVKIKTLRGRS